MHRCAVELAIDFRPIADELRMQYLRHDWGVNMHEQVQALADSCEYLKKPREVVLRWIAGSALVTLVTATTTTAAELTAPAGTCSLWVDNTCVVCHEASR
jgi:hypothetical protein